MAANSHEGIEPIDYAIFADVGEEPSWVYETIQALSEYRTPEGRPGPPILVRWLTDKAGNQVRLGDQLIDGNAGRFASIPAFIKHLNLFDRKGNAQGKGRRQCTREFKISVVERTIRREILGLKPGQIYKGPRVTQVFGLDFSEPGRIVRTKARLDAGVLSVGDFPLWDLQWERKDCTEYILEVWGREVLESACTFCPLVKTKFRRTLRDRDPAGHARACAVDRALRQSGAAASKMLDGELYVHRSLRPLEEVDLDQPESHGLVPAMFGDCEGLCGL